jgi:hypothetical protein
MNVLQEVLNELRGMFFGNTRLTIGITMLIAVVAALAGLFQVEPLAAGGVLLIGCIAILIETAVYTARSAASR